ncbi:Phosphatidylserine/phosphatidylglycerophosphate/cardiolipin synthase [Amycolatopsis tolypomycina]|uniref:Phosphatidylserine/phosphatidylglycerophosphate/cardiolipin synthase n=1 Tax=Amycolatopsis tolypomycina TaxID=208445 RepID=A0A1H4X7K1_9PSEU|nr:phospholipase D-like domain-containing protein [Amycolatopsis tolypomycina]SED01537.1 Phosphatidylserine/phosphatidylglycerophosphate/cardiolipin synthase [Amycolatopsis tolypomycina]
MGRVKSFPSFVDKVDERLGDGLEHVLCAHHRRRLHRLGWGAVLDPAGARDPLGGRAPVRDGNRVEVLIDGEESLPAVAEAIGKAKSHVHIANWHASADFRLTREAGSPTLRELLAEAAGRGVEVRVLLWAGPPFPAFQPSRKLARDERRKFTEGTDVRCVLDSRERTLHCHHEKLVIVDDAVAFVGGVDLTALEGDRHDSPDHPPRPIGWHDLMARLDGPVVADVADHFRRRWTEVAGEDLPSPAVPAPVGGSRVQLLRTVPNDTYDFLPKGEFTVLDGYLRALRSAQRLIYLENQFLWSPEIAEVLLDKLRHPPADEFRVVLLLPRKPSNGSDTTRGQLGRLLDADDGNRRLLATTISAHDGDSAAPVYVHAKLGIVDDSWLTIGSANLNEHSLFNDTEVNIATDDAEVVRTTRLRLWAEHLGHPVNELENRDSADIVDNLWRPLAEEQAERERRGEQRTHRLVLLPGVSRRVARLQGPLRGLLVDG